MVRPTNCPVRSLTVVLGLSFAVATAQPVAMTQVQCPPGYKAWALVQFASFQNATGPCGLALGPQNELYIAFENSRAVHRIYPDGDMRLLALINNAIEPIDVSPDGSFALVAYDGGTGLLKIPELDPDKVTNPSTNWSVFASFSVAKNQRVAFDTLGYVFTASLRLSPDGTQRTDLIPGGTGGQDRGDVSPDQKWFTHGKQRIRIRDSNGTLVTGQDWQWICSASYGCGKFDSKGNYWMGFETAIGTHSTIGMVTSDYWTRLDTTTGLPLAFIQATGDEYQVWFTQCGGIEDVAVDPYGTIYASDENNGLLMMISYNDDDGDQLPNSWELAHGLNSNDFSDGWADPDSNGLTNLQEYWHDADTSTNVLRPAMAGKSGPRVRFAGDVIRYTMPSVGSIVVEFLDLSGRRVARVSEAHVSAGTYSMPVDRYTRPSGMATEAYIVRVTVENASEHALVHVPFGRQ